MHTQFAVAVDMYQAHDGRVFLAVDTGDTKTQGNIRYTITVQQGAAPEVVLYSGAGFTGKTIELPSPGWYKYLNPLVVGSVYVPFGRSVSLYTTGNSDPSGGVSLHLCSSVSDMGALPIDTAGLVGEVRSAVVGGTGTNAALVLDVPQFTPPSLRQIPVDTDPLVPIHWFDVSITSSMHREGVYITDIAPGDPVNLWTYAGGPSSTYPALAGAVRPRNQPSRHGLPTVLITDDAERLSVDLRGENTPRIVNTTVFLVIDISNLVNSGVNLRSVCPNQTTTMLVFFQPEVRKDNTLHLYQYPYQYHINDPTAGYAIKTTTTYTAHNTVIVIAFCIMEQTESLTLSLYYHDTSEPATMVYTRKSPDIAQTAQEWITHLVIGAAGVSLHELRVHPGAMQTNDIAMIMTHLRTKCSTPEIFMPNGDVLWAWYDFTDPTLMSSDHSGVSMGVNHNDNVQYVKDKSGNNRELSSDIAHASYVDGTHPMAINNKGVLRVQVASPAPDSLRYQLTSNPPNQMSRLLVFWTLARHSSYAVHPSTTDNSSYLLNNIGRSRDVFGRGLPHENEVTILYDEPLHGNLAVSYASHDQDAQGNTAVTTSRMNTLETIAVQKTGTMDWFPPGNYLRYGIQTAHDTPTEWCLAEVIYWSTALDQVSIRRLGISLTQKWGWSDISKLVQQPTNTPLLLHLDASDTNTLYKDEAGTQAVATEGDPIRFIADKSGNGNHATRRVKTFADDGAIIWSKDRPATDSVTGAIRGKGGITGSAGFEYTILRFPKGITQSGATMVVVMKFQPYARFSGTNYKYIRHPLTPLGKKPMPTIMDGDGRMAEWFGYDQRELLRNAWPPLHQSADVPVLYVVVAGDSSQRTSTWTNGKQVDDSVETCSADLDNRYYMFAHEQSSSDGWYGDMLELRVYNKAFEANDLTVPSDELMTKWGVTPRS